MKLEIENDSGTVRLYDNGRSVAIMAGGNKTNDEERATTIMTAVNAHAGQVSELAALRAEVKYLTVSRDALWKAAKRALNCLYEPDPVGIAAACATLRGAVIESKTIQVEGVPLLRLSVALSEADARALSQYTSDLIAWADAERGGLVEALKQARDMVGHPDNIAIIDAALVAAPAAPMPIDPLAAVEALSYAREALVQAAEAAIGQLDKLGWFGVPVAVSTAVDTLRSAINTHGGKP